MGLINIPRSMYNHVPKIGCIKKENNTILGLTHIYIYTYIYIHIYIYIYIFIYIWLVVSTPLKNISQLGLLFP